MLRKGESLKFLSFDIESTGLKEDCLITEFACIPFDTLKNAPEENLAFECLIKCPPFEQLLPTLDEWVAKNQKENIVRSSQKGIQLEIFKTKFTNYLESKDIKDFFGPDKITLFGKSMNAIDLPFLNRDLGWEYMRKYFNHKVLDLSSAALCLIDLKLLPPEHDSSTKLMSYFNMGKVAHTALDDAKNLSYLYQKLIQKLAKGEV